MTQKTTQVSEKSDVLQKLCKALVDKSGCALFSNQVAMFNIIINTEKYAEYDFKSLLSNNQPFDPDSPISKKIYYSLSAKAFNSEDEVYVPENPFGDFLLISRSNCNAYIKGKNEIPKYWKQYLINSENDVKKMNDVKSNYFTPLGFMIQYYLLLSHSAFVRKEVWEFQKGSDYIEFISLTEKNWNYIVDQLNETGILELIGEKEDDLRSAQYPIRRLVKIIYNCLVKSVNPENGILFDEKKRIVDIDSERMFYEDKINCYGYKSIDRFNALKNNYLTNIFCACELGRIYYYGDNFYSVSCQYSIKDNREYAWDCYYTCVKDIPVNFILNDSRLKYAYNGLGEMVIQKMIDGTVNFDEGFEDALFYFNRCLDGGRYASARHNIGKLYRLRAIKKIKESKRNNTALSKDIIQDFEDFLHNTYMASEEGYVYSYNILANFLMNDEFEPVRENKQIRNFIIEKNIVLEDLLEKSAEGKNPWGLDQLANRYYKFKLGAKGLTNEQQLEYAEVLYREAFRMQYVWSAYHLVKYGYLCEMTSEYIDAIEIICDYFNKDTEEFNSISGILIDKEYEVDDNASMRRYISEKRKELRGKI